MKNICQGRVWASGDTDQCCAPAVVTSKYIENTGAEVSIHLCASCAKSHFESLKQEIVGDLGKVITNMRKITGLSKVAYWEPRPIPALTLPAAFVGDLTFISETIEDLRPKKII